MLFMMTSEQVQAAAARVRGNLLNATGGDISGNCFVAVLALREVLDSVSRVVGRYDGNPHEWAAAEVDGEVLFIDVTADQFGGPSILISACLPDEFSDYSDEEFDEALAIEFAAEVAALAA